jgi:hypothetical protein
MHRPDEETFQEIVQHAIDGVGFATDNVAHDFLLSGDCRRERWGSSDFNMARFAESASRLRDLRILLI